MKLLKTFSHVLAATAAFGLLAAPIASADQGRRGGGHDRGHNSRGHYDNGHHGNRGDHHRNDYRRDKYRGDHHHRRGDYRRHAPRYARNYHHSRRHYAPPPRYSYTRYSRAYGPYYHHGYRPRHAIGGWYRPHPRTVYITDYYSYGLYPPPPGYYWVRDYDSGDAVLASVATGAIIGLVIGALAYN